MPLQQQVKSKELVGTVISDKMAKTVVVRVTRLARHSMYEKVIRHYTNYKAHDGESRAKMGDTIRMVETRPLSRDKRWRVVQILSKQKGSEIV